jgi:hypothetical protein
MFVSGQCVHSDSASDTIVSWRDLYLCKAGTYDAVEARACVVGDFYFDVCVERAVFIWLHKFGAPVYERLAPRRYCGWLTTPAPPRFLLHLVEVEVDVDVHVVLYWPRERHVDLHRVALSVDRSLTCLLFCELCWLVEGIGVLAGPSMHVDGSLTHVGTVDRSAPTVQQRYRAYARCR